MPGYWAVGMALAACGLTAACGLSATAASKTVAAAGVSVPGCQTTAPPQQVLGSVRTASAALPAVPFGLTYTSTSQGRIAFVALRTRLGVVDTASLAPRLIRTVALPSGSLGKEGATGVTATHDGRYVLVAAGSGAIVVDAAKAAAGGAGAVVGTLTGTAGTSAIEVTVSPDDRYAVVSQEYGDSGTGGRGDIEVFDLRAALAGGFRSRSYIGSLVLGRAVVGTAIAPAGRVLYATSEVSPGSTMSGWLSVIDLARLETDPGRALLANVAAGCNPVRVAVAPDGRSVWVTARASNALLAFDTAKLTRDPSNALVASVQDGTAPVGLVFNRSGTRVLTADSDRFNATNATTGLTVVDTAAALNGQASAAMGRIPTGSFPREFALSPAGGKLLVSDFGSRQLQAVDTTTLP